MLYCKLVWQITCVAVGAMQKQLLILIHSFHFFTGLNVSNNDAVVDSETGECYPFIPGSWLIIYWINICIYTQAAKPNTIKILKQVHNTLDYFTFPSVIM